MGFDVEQVDRAIDHVVGVALEHPGTMTLYAQVLSSAGLSTVAPLGAFLPAFRHRRDRRGLPPLEALIVHATGPRRDFPDPVYFAMNRLLDPVAERTPIADKRDATTFWLHQIQTCRLWTARTQRS